MINNEVITSLRTSEFVVALVLQTLQPHLFKWLHKSEKSPVEILAFRNFLWTVWTRVLVLGADSGFCVTFWWKQEACTYVQHSAGFWCETLFIPSCGGTLPRKWTSSMDWSGCILMVGLTVVMMVELCQGLLSPVSTSSVKPTFLTVNSRNMLAAP